VRQQLPIGAALELCGVECTPRRPVTCARDEARTPHGIAQATTTHQHLVSSGCSAIASANSLLACVRAQSPSPPTSHNRHTHLQKLLVSARHSRHKFGLTRHDQPRLYTPRQHDRAPTTTTPTTPTHTHTHTHAPSARRTLPSGVERKNRGWSTSQCRGRPAHACVNMCMRAASQPDKTDRHTPAASAASSGSTCSARAAWRTRPESRCSATT
jgi:hypothetical protein